MIIKVPNFALYSEGDKKLSPDETIVFAFLYMYHNFDNMIITSIDLLNQKFKFKKGNDRENKPYIKEILLSLQEKEYILTNLSKLTTYDDIVEGYIINSESGYSGFESSVITNLMNENDLLDAKIKLHIYAVINRYTHSCGMKIEYVKLSSMCKYFKSKKNHSISKIQEVINEMDGKYLFRFSGNYKEESPEQESNLYFTQISEEKMAEYKKHVQFKNEKIEKKRKDDELLPQNIYHDIITVKELKEALEESNWHKRKMDGSYEMLEYIDYFNYRFAKDENVAPTKVRRIDAAIASLKDRDECEYDFDAWEREYQKDRMDLN